jgi:5-methylcytosine-specific restriction endonuclease McrA
MKEHVAELFKQEGVPQHQVAPLLKSAKELRLSRAQCVALEISHRKKLIEAGGKCGRCPRTDMLTTDHLVPKAILEVMGVDVERTFMPDNLVLLCRPCNGLKSARLDFSIPQTKVILLKLLEAL